MHTHLPPRIKHQLYFLPLASAERSKSVSRSFMVSSTLSPLTPLFTTWTAVHCVTTSRGVLSEGVLTAVVLTSTDFPQDVSLSFSATV